MCKPMNAELWIRALYSSKNHPEEGNKETTLYEINLNRKILKALSSLASAPIVKVPTLTGKSAIGKGFLFSFFRARTVRVLRTICLP